MVLNVPDARLIPINELNLEKDKIYCIEKETYLPSDSSGSIISDYSILTLKNNNEYKSKWKTVCDDC